MYKFKSYVMGTKVVVHTYNSAYKYLLQKKEAKTRFIRWVLLLQEFNLEIRDMKGSENVVTNHFSRLVNKGNKANSLPSQESFPDEQLFQISITNLPWFADYANFFIGQVLPLNI